jgi:hypothetical protein
MRFGKTNGWALIALGILLILLQGALVLMPKSDRKSGQDVPSDDRALLAHSHGGKAYRKARF